MVSDMVVWGYVFVLAIIHFFGEHLNDSAFAHQEKITSLSAGVTVTYVFLQLLPEHHRALDVLGPYGSLTVLGGFSFIYLAEKYVYKHEKSADEMRKDFRELHSAFLFMYYFTIGMMLHELLQRGLLDGTLFFIPVMFHTAISSFSLLELDEELLMRDWVRHAITLSVFIGAGFSIFIGINAMLFHIILGTLTGMFLFLVIHDSMPKRQSGAPTFFLIGMLCYTALMLYVWTLA